MINYRGFLTCSSIESQSVFYTLTGFLSCWQWGTWWFCWRYTETWHYFSFLKVLICFNTGRIPQLCKPRGSERGRTRRLRDISGATCAWLLRRRSWLCHFLQSGRWRLQTSCWPSAPSHHPLERKLKLNFRFYVEFIILISDCYHSCKQCRILLGSSKRTF